MNGVVSGALFAGYLTVTLFFLRFWRDSRDRLFGMFAAAFALLAFQRLALIIVMTTDLDDQTMPYLLRLLAFIVIIVAIIDKNRRPV